MTGALVCHPEPERPIRAEDWEGLATGTYRRPVRAIDESAPETGDLMRHFLHRGAHHLRSLRRATHHGLLSPGRLAETITKLAALLGIGVECI